MNKSLRIHKFLGLFLVVVLFFTGILTVTTVYAANYQEGSKRVFDDAGLFTEDEIQRLETQLAKAIKEHQVDFAVVTTDNAQGKSAMTYADDFYYQHGLGYDKPDGDGILYLIDMDNREIWLCTVGVVMDNFTESRVDKVLDAAYDEVRDGDYYDSAVEFIKVSEKYVNLDPNAKEPMTVGGILMRLVIALVVAGVAVFVMVSGAGGKVTVNSYDFFEGSKEQMIHQNDRFIRKLVTTRVIPKADTKGGGGGGGFGSHMTGGGSSHGGGGRSF